VSIDWDDAVSPYIETELGHCFVDSHIRLQYIFFVAKNRRIDV